MVDSKAVHREMESGEWVTQKIGDQGGNFTDIIHTIHGRIPEPDASITTEYIENENLGHRVAPGVFIGGTEQGLDVLNVSDLVASKGVALASFQLLVRNIGKIASKTGVANSRAMGSAMEQALGMTNSKTAINVGGRTRFPDRLDLLSGVLEESKNVKHLNFTVVRPPINQTI